METQYSVKQIRAKRHLTQAEMAKAIGISPNTYRRKEKTGKWTLIEIAKISALSGVNASAIH